MGLYSDGASRPSFVHPREIAGGARASPRPRPRGSVVGGHQGCPRLREPACDCEGREPETWWSAASASAVTPRAQVGSRRLGLGSRASKRPTDPAVPPTAASAARNGRKRLRAKARAAASPFPPSLLVAALRLRLLVLGALLLAMGDRQGTWNGPAARPSWRGTRLANQPNAFCCCRGCACSSSHTVGGAHRQASRRR